jgi:hypothetical protein
MRVSGQGTSRRRRRLTRLAVVADEDDVLSRSFQRGGTPMLSRVKPYSDLILSPAEMERFIAEAAALIPAVDELGADRLTRVLQLARQCRDQPGTEFHFQGD